MVESFVMAVRELTVNKLRTFLSLTGITIGIFCIIAVLSVIDSFEVKIRNTFSRLGSDVIYVSKFPWAEDPDANWWKYNRRPDPNYDDFEYIKDNVVTASAVSFAKSKRMKEIKFANQSITDISMFGPTHDFDAIWQFDYSSGRYFTEKESHIGADIALLGATVAEELFGGADPIGRKIKADGRSLTVIGVLAKEGENMMGDGWDDNIIVPYNNMKKYINFRNLQGGLINVAPASGISLERLKSDIRLALRSGRRLRPGEEDNFALNQLSILSGLLDQVFKVINIAGWIIGGFSILVGGFGIANIMFVSVRERTKIIGIKKSLGAKPYMILSEFLIEAIVLCIIGGLTGVLSVFVLSRLMAYLNPDYKFDLYLNNLFLAVGLSIAIGLISGFLPALRAAAMNPVDAIRGK